MIVSLPPQFRPFVNRVAEVDLNFSSVNPFGVSEFDVLQVLRNFSNKSMKRVLVSGPKGFQAAEARRAYPFQNSAFAGAERKTSDCEVVSTVDNLRSARGGLGYRTRERFVAAGETVITAIQPNEEEQIASQLPVGLAEKVQKGGERGGVLSNDLDEKVPHRDNM